ncbi:MAG: rod shape-determining protein MreD [Candidatus Omnitrophota bacterium]
MYKFKPLKIAALILILSFIETGFFSEFPFLNVKIEFLLILALFLGFFAGKRQLYFYAFFCGMIKDMFSIVPFGVNIIAFLAAAFFAKTFSLKFFEVNKLVFAVFVFVSVLLTGCIAFFLSAQTFARDAFESFLRIILINGFVSALISPLLFSFFKLILIGDENK